MPVLAEEDISALLAPYLGSAPAPDSLYKQLGVYLDLLLTWNARTNLTAVREPAEIVRRHFGESLFLAAHLPPCRTFLDYGSGAGFPGIPVALFRPELAVTLAESRGKKAAFLRETVRALGIVAEVWPARVERMPADRTFDVVALRAVDKMPQAIKDARRRVSPGGKLALLTAHTEEGLRVPESHDRTLVLTDC